MLKFAVKESEITSAVERVLGCEMNAERESVYRSDVTTEVVETPPQ